MLTPMPVDLVIFLSGFGVGMAVGVIWLIARIIVRLRENRRLRENLKQPYIDDN
jgi:CHASE1-domain containing sensor protein